MSEAEEDISFLLARAMCAGSCSFRGDRWTGMSSNSIVAVAYGGSQKCLPYDRSDYMACVRTVRRLPRHRQTLEVRDALKRAREAYLKHSPADRFPKTRKAEREKWERERAEWQKQKRRRRRAA